MPFCPQKPSKEPIVVALSGGVDSAVSALLLLEAGYEVQALFMKNWEEDDRGGHCAAAKDLADAQSVCDTLGVPLRTVNFATEYWDKVFQCFLAELRAGRTPNPDVLCNREIKFSEFMDFALTMGGQRVATGHYARLETRNGRTRLLKGVDSNKDQSYFLHTLGQSQLSKALFPLGELHKHTVRAMARRACLSTHDKKDSTGICFIGERPFKDFVKQYISPQPGPIETGAGERVGEHEGLMFYTRGQRQGLGIGGRADGTGGPWYVAGKDVERNALIVVQGHEHPALYTRALAAKDCHWVAERPAAVPFACHAKTRYRQREQPCTITVIEENRCRVRFDQPQWAVTGGQSVVFYKGEECLGGGVISATGTQEVGVEPNI